MPLGQIADDIILRLTQSAPSDDSEIEKAQVMYLIAQTRDMLVKQYLDKQIAQGQPLDTQYKDRVSAETMELEDTDEVAQDNERLFVTIPNQPLPLYNDLGVLQVLTQEYLPVLRQRAENFTVYQDLRFARPSSFNLCFYRDNRKIIIKGLSQKNRDNDKFIIDYFPALASQTLTDTTDARISDALLPQLTELVETVMKRQMYESVQDQENDGVQEPSK